MNTIKIYKINSREHNNLIAAASFLGACAGERVTFSVRETYFDLGQNWMWTTIIRDGDNVQILNPRDHAEIVTARNADELYKAIKKFC